MQRLLILALLGYLAYRLLVRRPSGSPPPPAAGADDVLVQDPVCQTYIVRQGAETCHLGGTTYYFCSPQCRDKFKLETRS